MTAETSWRARAMCDGLDPDEMDRIFFPHPNDRALEAKAICRVCPVAASCLTHALETGEESGVWGAMTESERAALQRRRSRPNTGGVRASKSVNEPTPDERCGEYAGVRAHRKRLEWLCDDCRDARAIYENGRRARVAADRRAAS